MLTLTHSLAKLVFITVSEVVLLEDILLEASLFILVDEQVLKFQWISYFHKENANMNG